MKLRTRPVFFLYRERPALAVVFIAALSLAARKRGRRIFGFRRQKGFDRADAQAELSITADIADEVKVQAAADDGYIAVQHPRRQPQPRGRLGRPRASQAQAPPSPRPGQ